MAEALKVLHRRTRDEKGSMSLTPMAASSLRAAGIVGVWNTNVQVGRSLLDVGAATLLAGSPDLAGKPLPIEVALGRMHPDDRDWVFGQIRRTRQTGGPFAAEFRIVTEVGETRWILNRGHLALDENGRMHGQGAFIDTTDAHPSSDLPAAALSSLTADPLIEVVDHALLARAAIDRSNSSQLRLFIDMLLLETARAIARRRST